MCKFPIKKSPLAILSKGDIFIFKEFYVGSGKIFILADKQKNTADKAAENQNQNGNRR